MKHRNKGRYLNRDSSHRKLMFYNMSKEVIKYGIIKTTLPKAKELRRYLEPLITLSKVNNLSNRRRVFSRARQAYHRASREAGLADASSSIRGAQF